MLYAVRTGLDAAIRNIFKNILKRKRDLIFPLRHNVPSLRRQFVLVPRLQMTMRHAAVAMGFAQFDAHQI